MHSVGVDPEAVGLDGVPQADVASGTVIVAELGEDTESPNHMLLSPPALLIWVRELGDDMNPTDQIWDVGCACWLDGLPDDRVRREG